MSSVPPNMPPAGGTPPPYPPYDPKTQWRVYREQQKAAWRAQRDAWKAQRHAMKASYVGAYGPRVPSVVGPIILIAVGIVALLMVTGHIAAGPVLGLVWPLVAAAADRRRPGPAGRVGARPAPRDPCPPRRQLCRHPHPAGHHGLLAPPDGTTSGVGTVARRLATAWRRLLQRLRPARARHRPAGAEDADSRQRRHRDREPARRRQHHRRRRLRRSRCRRTKWPLPTPTPRRKKIFDCRSCARDSQRQRRAGQVGQQQQRPPQPDRHRSQVRTCHASTPARRCDRGRARRRHQASPPHGDVHLSSIAGSVQAHFSKRQARLLRPRCAGRRDRRRRLERPHPL